MYNTMRGLKSDYVNKYEYNMGHILYIGEVVRLILNNNFDGICKF